MAENFRVSGFVLGLAIKAPVRTFTTAPIVLSGLQTINSYVTEVNDRVLVMNQVNPIDNGIYSAQISVWKRDGDSDGNRDWVGGTIVPAYRPTDGEIVLFNVDGAPAAITVGLDSLTFSVYFDGAAVLPDAPSDGMTYGRNNANWVVVAAEDLQQTTVQGNTTDQGIGITTGALLGIFDAADAESVTVGINSVILAPAPALQFAASANIEAYHFDEPINCDGAAVHVLSTGRLAFYRYGDAVLSYIRGAAASNNIEYVAVGADHIFTGDVVEIPAYRIPVLQFSIVANSVTIDVNQTSACLIDVEEASANFAVVLTAPAAGTGFYVEILIDISQGSGLFDAIWPASVKWPDGVAPVITAVDNARDTVHLWTRDGGTTWSGSFLQDNS